MLLICVNAKFMNQKKRRIKQLEQKLFLNLDHPEFEEIVGQMESLL